MGLPVLFYSCILQSSDAGRAAYDPRYHLGLSLNILYLVLKGLLDLPVLYRSRFITPHKAAYYP